MSSMNSSGFWDTSRHPQNGLMCINPDISPAAYDREKFVQQEKEGLSFSSVDNKFLLLGKRSTSVDGEDAAAAVEKNARGNTGLTKGEKDE